MPAGRRMHVDCGPTTETEYHAHVHVQCVMSMTHHDAVMAQPW